MQSLDKPRSRFGDQLAAEFERHATIKSVRRLAREMSSHGGNGSFDSSRRLLHDWIAGTKKPTVRSRRVVAASLGVETSVFADDDDEEDALSAILHASARLKALRARTGDEWAVVR